MTDALPIAWIALVLGGLALGYIAARDWLDGRRIERLEKLTAGLRGDITEMLRDHRRDLAAINARIDSLRVPGPDEPATRPILRVPTDTVEREAAIDVGLATITTEVASYGRHAHRMPR